MRVVLLLLVGVLSVGPAAWALAPGAGGISEGNATTSVLGDPTGTLVSVTLSGRIALDGGTYRGTAGGGGTATATSTGWSVSPFTLSGTSGGGRILATCSGSVIDLDASGIVGPAVGAMTLELKCTGRVDNRPAGTTTMYAGERETASSARGGAFELDFAGPYR